MSGDSTEVDELMQACGSIVAQKAQEGENMEKLSRSSLLSDVHVVASVLKAYLREQQEPILPNKLYDSFLAAAGTCMSLSNAQWRAHVDARRVR